jgi:CRISPR-associated protein Cas2
VSYDIRDDARLRKVARLLESYGERIQYSVFRCRLTGSDEQQLRWKLTRLTKQEDAWLIIPLCGSCVQRISRHSGMAAWPPEPPDYLVV